MYLYTNGIFSSSVDAVIPFSDDYSFEFDGVSDYIETNNAYSRLDSTTKASWSYWVKPTLGVTMVLSRVSSTTSTSDFVYMFYLFSTGEVGASIGDTTRRARTGSNVLTNNVWSHVLVCYDGTLTNGSKTKIFINGVDSTSSDSTTSTSLVNANYPLSIGRRDQTPTYYYEGFMNEIAMWSGTDLRNDSSTIYNSGLPDNLNNNGLTPPTTWLREENATHNGSEWDIIDSGSGGDNATSNSMTSGSRTSDVPT